MLLSPHRHTQEGGTQCVRFLCMLFLVFIWQCASKLNGSNRLKNLVHDVLVTFLPGSSWKILRVQLNPAHSPVFMCIKHVLLKAGATVGLQCCVSFRRTAE